jgi:hypothetical protein
MTNPAFFAKVGLVGGAGQAPLLAGPDQFFDLLGREGLTAAQLVEHIGDTSDLFQGFGAVVGVERAAADGQAAMSL